MLYDSSSSKDMCDLPEDDWRSLGEWLRLSLLSIIKSKDVWMPMDNEDAIDVGPFCWFDLRWVSSFSKSSQRFFMSVSKSLNRFFSLSKSFKLQSNIQSALSSHHQLTSHILLEVLTGGGVDPYGGHRWCWSRWSTGQSARKYWFGSRPKETIPASAELPTDSESYQPPETNKNKTIPFKKSETRFGNRKEFQMGWKCEAINFFVTSCSTFSSWNSRQGWMRRLRRATVFKECKCIRYEEKECTLTCFKASPRHLFFFELRVN